jgi:hypothetical protein
MPRALGHFNTAATSFAHSLKIRLVFELVTDIMTEGAGGSKIPLTLLARRRHLWDNPLAPPRGLAM